MKKRVFIVHGWEGHTEEHWFPWLKKELETKEFEVFIPQLPDTDNPRIDNWIPKLSQVVGLADENTYFVGHSMGCQAIIRYLETLPEGVKVGGAVFVAGFLKRVNTSKYNQKIQEMFKHWLVDNPINFKKVRSHLSQSAAIFSDNDKWVPLDNQDDFRDQLGSEIVIEHQKGHFCESDGVIKLLVVLEGVLNFAKKS